MGSALAATSGDWRGDRRPIRRRCCVGISAPRRRRAVPPRLEGTPEPVRTRAAPGQDAVDRVRALRSRKPKERGAGKPETFNFLGFTHICGQTWKSGKFLVL